MATALDSQGCAVCDGFLSIDEVRGVRAEIKALEHHYKASEIWVGKNSDIGAHITVPRVRGDKVTEGRGCLTHATRICLHFHQSGAMGQRSEYSAVLHDSRAVYVRGHRPPGIH